MDSALEERSKAARKVIVQSGMRVGRSGIIVSAGGIVLTVGAWQVKSGLSSVGMSLGALLAVFGLIPFALGWSQSRRGAPFLRALSEEGVVKALLLDTKPLPGLRRSLALLLNDGSRQTMALKESDARTVVDIVGQLSPSADTGERAEAQKIVAKLVAA